MAASLAQIGEFSFILAGLGVALGVLPPEGRDLILAGALISIALNPVLFRLVEPAQAWIRARSALARTLERPEDPLAELPESVQSRSSRVMWCWWVTAGSGRRLAGVAGPASGSPMWWPSRTGSWSRTCAPAASRRWPGTRPSPAVLIQAHVARAALLVIAAPDAARARRMIEIARMLNPRIAVLVRTHSEEEAALLGSEPGVRTFLGEHELADSMGRYVLGQLATRAGAASAKGD